MENASKSSQSPEKAAFQCWLQFRPLYDSDSNVLLSQDNAVAIAGAESLFAACGKRSETSRTASEKPLQNQLSSALQSCTAASRKFLDRLELNMQNNPVPPEKIAQLGASLKEATTYPSTQAEVIEGMQQRPRGQEPNKK